MIAIEIVRLHSLPLHQAKRVVVGVVHDMEVRLGLFGLTQQWQGDALRLDGLAGFAQGTHGLVAVSEGSVHLSLSLSPALQVMRATIESSLRGFFDRAFDRRA